MDSIARRFREVAPAVDFCSLRVVEEQSELLQVRKDVLQPVKQSTDLGAMVTVVAGSGLGYAATSDLSASGLRAAADTRPAAQPVRDSCRHQPTHMPPGRFRPPGGIGNPKSLAASASRRQPWPNRFRLAATPAVFHYAGSSSC